MAPHVDVGGVSPVRLYLKVIVCVLKHEGGVPTWCACMKAQWKVNGRDALDENGRVYQIKAKRFEKISDQLFHYF